MPAAAFGLDLLLIGPLIVRPGLRASAVVLARLQRCGELVTNGRHPARIDDTPEGWLVSRRQFCDNGVARDDVNSHDSIQGDLNLMRSIPRKLLVAGSLAALVAGAGVQPVLAQRTSQVKFRPGNYGTMVTGTIAGRDYIDYQLNARKGQKMFAELAVSSTNGNGSVYFNILPPGSTDEAIYIGQNDNDNSALLPLPTTGTYTIRVYLMGNDRDTGKTVGFNLDLSIQ